MNETHITIVGNVVDIPRHKRLDTRSVTNFRMASTARRFDSEVKDFVDSTTLWIDVACWGDLAGNVAHSVSKGDPVIVEGTIATDTWDSDAGRRSAAKIRASSVGLNLARGWAQFHRATRSTTAAESSATPAPEDPGGIVGTFGERPTDYEHDPATSDPDSAPDAVAARSLEPAR